MTIDSHDSDLPGHAEALAHQATDDLGEDRTHDDHAYDDTDPLGPIDVYAWGAGALGVVLGLAVAWAFALATRTTI